MLNTFAFNLLLAAGDANPLEHVVPHEIAPHAPFWLNNQMVMATVAAVLMLIIFPRLFGQSDAEPPRGAKNFFESILEFLRLEVFRPALKEHTERFLPFLWTLFFFILFSNVLGAIPFGAIFTLFGIKSLSHFGGTATGNINTTGALAVAAFFVIHANGLAQVYRALRDGTYGHHEAHEEHSSSGAKHHEAAHDVEHMRGEAIGVDAPGDFRALGDPTHHYADDQHLAHGRGHVVAPGVAEIGHGAGHGKGMSAGGAFIAAVPYYLWNFAPHPFRPQPDGSGSWIADFPIFLLLLVLELIGALIKPFSLCIRLFANMIAGHIVLASLVILILMAPTLGGQVGIGIPVLLLSLLISVLELFVAFLQAYIFTFLTTLFIGSAIAPEH